MKDREVMKMKVPSEAKFDARLLSWGVFEGLDGFMDKSQWERVCQTGMLDGAPMGLPMTLPLSEQQAGMVQAGQTLLLLDEALVPFCRIEAGAPFEIDPMFEARHVLGTTDSAHPWVAKLLSWGNWRVGGKITSFCGDLGADPFKRWLSPEQAKAMAASMGWSGFAAMQTRNPLHGAHLDLVRRSLEREGVDGVLIHPAMGITKPGDLSPEIRARCYEAALAVLPTGRAALSYAPLAMRMAGPREALWHASIRKGFGASAFIVGRDHAGPGLDSSGVPFYKPQAAMEMAQEHEKALGIAILAFEESVYSQKRKRFIQPNEVSPGDKTLSLSGTAMRGMLERSEMLPEWFTPKEVAQELAGGPVGGVCVMLTGLSASGKTTIAERLAQRWRMATKRPMTILDGDDVRKMLSSELGFSKEHRDLNITRLGFVAAEISKHGGACVMSAIAPYDQARKDAMARMRASGVACLAHVSTSLSECESRDPKGLYAKARLGLLKGFTGIDDPYEEPPDADLRLDLGAISVEQACEAIESWLGAQASGKASA